MLLDLAGSDGNALTLHADESAKERRRLSMKAQAVTLELGSDDREFRLTRA
jgi:hypothetical protein